MLSILNVKNVILNHDKPLGAFSFLLNEKKENIKTTYIKIMNLFWFNMELTET